MRRPPMPSPPTVVYAEFVAPRSGHPLVLTKDPSPEDLYAVWDAKEASQPIRLTRLSLRLLISILDTAPLSWQRKTQRRLVVFVHLAFGEPLVRDRSLP